MRILYVAFRHNPLNPDLASGADYQFFQSLRDNGCDLSLIGPYSTEPWLIEKIIMRAHKLLSKKKYAKYPISTAWQVSQALNQAVKTHKPDLVFTIFPPALTFYNRNVPCIYRQDTSFWGWQNQYPVFSWMGYRLSIWLERKVFNNVDAIITQSNWNREILLKNYHLKDKPILVFPNPAALPTSVVPDQMDIQKTKKLESPLRLLFIGRDPHRKGEDLALSIVSHLEALQVPTQLKICGPLSENNYPNVEYVGLFNKSEPSQLQQYISLFQEANLLIHPARFDPSPIVSSEAAAFGTPTITNNVGGIETSVKTDVSGIVLPKDSPAEAYAHAILDLINDPERYYRLCETTRQRYEQELNWDVTSKRVVELVRRVVAEHKDKQ